MCWRLAGICGKAKLIEKPQMTKNANILGSSPELQDGDCFEKMKNLDLETLYCKIPGS